MYYRVLIFQHYEHILEECLLNNFGKTKRVLPCQQKRNGEAKNQEDVVNEDTFNHPHNSQEQDVGIRESEHEYQEKNINSNSEGGACGGVLGEEDDQKHLRQENMKQIQEEQHTERNVCVSDTEHCQEHAHHEEKQTNEPQEKHQTAVEVMDVDEELGTANINNTDENGKRSEDEIESHDNMDTFADTNNVFANQNISIENDTSEQARDPNDMNIKSLHTVEEPTHNKMSLQSEISVAKKETEIKEIIVLEKDFKKTKAFARKCATLCWLMRIKDPPLHIVYKIEHGQKMDTESFKHYTQSGKVMKFVVWPALFLYDGGALLAKGVAQPIKKAEEEEYEEKLKASLNSVE